MKWHRLVHRPYKDSVALFTRAWIEISSIDDEILKKEVALFTRAWIEIAMAIAACAEGAVALFTRAWIEICFCLRDKFTGAGRPLHEGVD